MALRKHKKSAVDRRLKHLDAEMARLNAEIKQLSGTGGARVPGFPTRLRGKTHLPARNDIDRLQGDPAAHGDGKRGPIKEKYMALSEAPAEDGADGGGSQRDENISPLPSRREDVQSHTGGRRGRERFVSYFAAGHFQDLRPLRQNKNALRNKAIMMAVLAALAVFGLLFHLFGR